MADIRAAVTIWTKKQQKVKSGRTFPLSIREFPTTAYFKSAVFERAPYLHNAIL